MLPAAAPQARLETAPGSVSPRIVGSGPALHRVLDVVARVADARATVLITGESGTGKELIARALHAGAHGRVGRFVAVNCAAIPEELLEAELFGHVRGAFTQAVQDREGRFTLADGGTIFLDEIADMSPSLQVKLLRVLEDGRFEPVGSSRSQSVDVRVIAATNQRLPEEMAAGRFRRDLFYRLNVVPIELPPLRERREDIPELVAWFLERIAEERAEKVEISAAAMERLCAHDWPGNVRELQNLVQRVVILNEGQRVDVEQLPPPFHTPKVLAYAHAPRVPETGLCFAHVVNRFETDLIRQALELTQWNKSRAAQILDVNRTTLLEMIKKKGLAPPL